MLYIANGRAPEKGRRVAILRQCLSEFVAEASLHETSYTRIVAEGKAGMRVFVFCVVVDRQIDEDTIGKLSQIAALLGIEDFGVERATCPE